MDRNWSNQKKSEYIMDFSNKTDIFGQPRNVKLPKPANPGLGAGRTGPWSTENREYNMPRGDWGGKSIK